MTAHQWPAPLLAGNARLTRPVLARAVEQGSVIESAPKTGAPKVVRLTDEAGQGWILKLFHPDRGISSTWLSPYARRFRKNAARLRARDVRAPEVLGWGRFDRWPGIDFVCYPELPGHSLRSLIPDVDLASAAAFIATLHARSIDFRALHMGNLLWDESTGYSVIDVTDCYFPRRLNTARRLRRLAYFCRHGAERAYLAHQDNWQHFLHAYAEASGLEAAELIERVGRLAGLSTGSGREHRTDTA